MAPVHVGEYGSLQNVETCQSVCCNTSHITHVIIVCYDLNLTFIWLKNRWCWGDNFKKCHNILSWYSHKHHLWGWCCTSSFWSGLDFQQHNYWEKWEVKLFIYVFIYLLLFISDCIPKDIPLERIWVVTDNLSSPQGLS